MAEVQNFVPVDAVPSVKQAVGAEKHVLIDRLDALLEQYLNTLDEYDKLMQQLSKQLSSAYFTLTQANFHNRSGVHYGQDSYDERTQATRRIVVTEDEENQIRYSTASTLSPPPPSAESKSNAGKKDKSPQPEDDAEATDASQNEPTKDEPKPESTDTESNDTESNDTESKETEPAKPTAKDPIRMFGILVPPALRTAQASFADAVDGPVVRLAGVAGDLRALEREIGRARKAVRKA